MARTISESALRNPLDHILGVDSNVRVLRALVRHGGLLSASDISRRADLSKSSTRLGLLSLQDSGIILSEGTGHSRLCRFNPDHYLSEAIRTLFTAEQGRFSAILESVANSPGDQKPYLKALWIYGSVARGEDRRDSDLDIAAVADAADLARVVEAIREALAAQAEHLGFTPSVVGLDMEDVGRMAGDDDPWWQNLAEDAIVVLGASPGDLALEARGPTFG